MFGTVHAAPVEISESTFPDPNFRALISGPEYDRDGNGIIDDSEIALTINIHCEGMGIYSLQGVEYFYALQGLWCQNNNISSVDLSANKDLHGLWCSDNAFTSLDLSQNPELEWVYCYDCNLTYLNVSNNPKMAYIECNTNPLTSLDVTHNPLLEHLTCGSCSLTSLDLSGNPNLSHLDAFRNCLTSLDVTHNPKLKRLDIWDNAGLGSIDISQNPGLQYYNCAHNGATTIDVSHNPQLQKLICSYNSITSINLSNNPKLFYLDCACNQLASLDVSHNPELSFLQAFTNPFTTLNINFNPILLQTYFEGKKKDESSVCRGHSWTIDYGGDTSTGGDNILFLCFDDSVTLTADRSALDSSDDAAGTTTTAASNADLVTRETVVWTLYNFAGKPSVAGLSSRFKDVAAGSWYEDALLWGEKNAIALGYPYISSDKFGVGEYITRQDLCLMLMRYSEFMNYKRAIDFGRTDEYKDYYDIDQYAWEAVTWAVTWHIMEGKGDLNAPGSEQMIDPHGQTTRAEFEAMYRKMMEVNSKTGPAAFPLPDTSVAGTLTNAGTGDDAAGSMATGSADETVGSGTGSDTIASDGTPDIGTVTDGTVAADSDPASGISSDASGPVTPDGSDAAEFSSGNSMTFTTKIFLLFLLIALAAGVIIAYNRFGKNRDTKGKSNG